MPLIGRGVLLLVGWLLLVQWLVARAGSGGGVVHVSAAGLLSPNKLMGSLSESVNRAGAISEKPNGLLVAADVVTNLLATLFFTADSPDAVTLDELTRVIDQAILTISQKITKTNRDNDYKQLYSDMTTASKIMDDCSSFLESVTPSKICTHYIDPVARTCPPGTYNINSPTLNKQCFDNLYLYSGPNSPLGKSLRWLKQDQKTYPTSARPITTLVQGVAVMHIIAAQLIKIRNIMLPDYATSLLRDEDFINLKNIYTGKDGFLNQYLNMRNALVDARLNALSPISENVQEWDEQHERVRVKFTQRRRKVKYTMIDSPAEPLDMIEAFIPNPVLPYNGSGAKDLNKLINGTNDGKVFIHEICDDPQILPSEEWTAHLAGVTFCRQGPERTLHSFAEDYKKELNQRISQQLYAWDNVMCSNQVSVEAARHNTVNRPCWSGLAPTINQHPTPRSPQRISDARIPFESGVAITQNRNVLYAIWVTNGLTVRASPIPGDGQSFDWITIWWQASGPTSIGAPTAVQITDDQLTVYYVAATGKLNFYRIIFHPAEHDYKPRTIKQVLVNDLIPIFSTPNSVYQALTMTDTVRAVVHDGYIYLAFKKDLWWDNKSVKQIFISGKALGVICVARFPAENYWILDSDVTCTSEPYVYWLTPRIAVFQNRLYMVTIDFSRSPKPGADVYSEFYILPLLNTITGAKLDIPGSYQDVGSFVFDTRTAVPSLLSYGGNLYLVYSGNDHSWNWWACTNCNTVKGDVTSFTWTSLGQIAPPNVFFYVKNTVSRSTSPNIHVDSTTGQIALVAIQNDQTPQVYISQAATWVGTVSWCQHRTIEYSYARFRSWGRMPNDGTRQQVTKYCDDMHATEPYFHDINMFVYPWCGKVLRNFGSWDGMGPAQLQGAWNDYDCHHKYEQGINIPALTYPMNTEFQKMVDTASTLTISIDDDVSVPNDVSARWTVSKIVLVVVLPVVSVAMLIAVATIIYRRKQQPPHESMQLQLTPSDNNIPPPSHPIHEDASCITP